MVSIVTVGVLSIQGAISEHRDATRFAMRNAGRKGSVISIRAINDLKRCDALILPGGESTTISKNLINMGLFDEIRKRIDENDLPILGTCAGCVLLSSDVVDDVGEVTLFKAMKMKVERNAFGGQCASFEKYVDIKGFSKPFPAIFIRAPIITETWGNCEVVSELDEKRIIGARQGNLLAVSFHPELTSDDRIHQMLLEMI